MPTEDDDSLDLLLSNLLRLPAEQRAAELERVTASNPDLRERLEQLLQAHRDAGDFLEKPAVTVPEELRTTEPLERPGTVIDRYKLLELIGEGGFGAVYMAEQSEPVRRKVALKIIKLGMDTKQVIARFEAERQALTMMDHPNIAKVLDAGATETGRPYFVMELVKGDPVTEYCDRQNLGTRQRLEIFRQVCHAVQHAHQKGVIHRDLKPSNVLVTVADGQPIPKVIDFGIAKATGRELTDKTFFTEFRQLIGTPEYMSPEQAEISGIDIDTRSDIYALGVLLYELLTGTTPFDAQRLRSAAFGELQRIIREEDPDKPSTRVRTLLVASGSSRDEPQAQAPAQSSSAPDTSSAITIAKHRHTDPQSLCRDLRGDLDWIVMKCLEKDRTRRYETANGVASDIQRHLENQPVVAGPPTAAYRVRKFVRRNRVMVTAATMVVAALLAGMAGTTFGLLRAEQRRAESEAAREQTQQVSDFQAEMLSDIDVEAMGRGIKECFREQVRAALERQYVGEFPDRRQRTAEEIDAELAAFDQRAGAAQAVDVARRVMDEFVLAHAADALEEQFTNQPLVRAQLHSALGSAYWHLGINDAAEPHLLAALEIREGELGDDHPDTLTSISGMGGLLHSQGKRAEAERYYREALEGRRRVLGYDHPDTLNSINRMGVLFEKGNPAEAERYYREALEGRRRVLGDDHPDTLISIDNMGSVLQAQGELPEAELHYREALEGFRRVLGDEHRDTLTSISNMGRLLEARGKLAEAEQYYREAMKGIRRVRGDDHPETLASINNLGLLLQQRNKLDEADACLREALEGCRRVLGDDHPQTLASINNMGLLLKAQGKLAEAEPYFREALEGKRRDHPSTLPSIYSLGVVLRQQGKLAEAEPYLREALEGCRRVLGEEHHGTLRSMNSMGVLLRQQGKLAEAEPYIREALETSRRVLGDGHPVTLSSISSMGVLLEAQGKPAEAEPYLREALEGRRRVLGDEHPDTLKSLEKTSQCLAEQGKLEESLTLCRDFIEHLRSKVPDGDTALGGATGSFGQLLVDHQEYEEAEPLLRECLQIRENTLDPDSVHHWLIAQTRSLLGGALVGRGAAVASSNPRQAIELFTEAEPLILDSYEWLITNFEQIDTTYGVLRIKRVNEAGERVLWLYDAWHAVEPDAGHDARAAEFRARLEDLPGP